MPEGPEVRKFADALDAALTGRAIVSFEARTKEARKWLHENEQRLRGRRVERVVSHGKHLLGYIEGSFTFALLVRPRICTDEGRIYLHASQFQKFNRGDFIVGC
jgi:endonuclease-8